MSHESGPVQEAITRWVERGLVPSELAARLRAEVEASAEAGTARLTQYLLASAGAVVLLIAGGIFVDWAWPLLNHTGRATVLGVAGLLVHVGGAAVELRKRWTPAALLLQTAGLGLMLGAFLYAPEAWEGAQRPIVGVLALAVPIVLAPRSFRRSVFMPAVHLCFGLAFFVVFLDKTTPLSDDQITWAVDLLLFVSALGLVRLLRDDPYGERHPWALNAFVVSLYAGLILVLVTASGPLHMGEDAIYPVDVWWGLIVALTLWGIHRAPEGLRREWFGTQLAWTIALWIPLGIMTSEEALHAPEEVALLLVSGVGAAAFAYAVRFRVRRVLIIGTLAFISGVWFWAVERAGALGAVAALAVTAAALFVLSGHIRKWVGDDEAGDEQP